MRVTLEPELPTDSADYDVITKGVELSANIEGLTCEIGFRRGGGSKYIIDALHSLGLKKTHIAVDPFGNIEYPEGNRVIRCDYTNTMRDEAMVEMYLYCRRMEQNFIFFNLEDTEFFKRFSDGVPVYSEHKEVLNLYSFIHLDGPHTVPALHEEINFFHDRTNAGAVMVFDDVKLYDHNTIHKYLKELGWEIQLTSDRKWCYSKQ